MHIPDAVLSAPVIAAGTTLAAGGVVLGLATMKEQAMVRVAVLSSAFFVASLIHIPLGPASVHLMLTALCGVLLGWAAFPAIAIGLVLQALFFGYGGITTLGVNTFIMAAPAVICYYVFNRAIRRCALRWVFPLAFMAGSLAIVVGSVLLAAALIASGREYSVVGSAVFVAQLPLVFIEGFVTASTISFLRKARPEALDTQGRDGLPWQESGECPG
jgi:cobalt/nickel transport system permease protein